MIHVLGIRACEIPALHFENHSNDLKIAKRLKVFADLNERTFCHICCIGKVSPRCGGAGVRSNGACA